MKLFKNILLILLFLSFVEIIFAQNFCSEKISCDWLKSFGSNGNEIIKDVACDNNNNIIVAGFTNTQFSIANQNITFPNSNYAFFVAKFDPQGNITWIKAATTVNTYDNCNCKIAIDSYNNIFLLGDFYSSLTIETTTLTATATDDQDIFLLKFSDNGNLLFANKYGSQGENYAGGIAVDNNDNVIFNGFFENTMIVHGNALFPYGAGDNFIIKLSNSGDYIWSKDYGSTDFDAGKNLTCDNNGNIYSLGIFRGSIFAGAYQITANTTNAFYLIKLNPSGNVLFAVKDEIAENSEINAIAVDNEENVFVAYKQYSTNNYLLQKYTNNGNLSTTKNYNNVCMSISDIACDKDNFCYITGYFCPGTAVNFGDNNMQNSSLANNIFIVKYSPDALFVDKKIQNLSPNACVATSMAIQNGKDIIVAGKNSGVFSIDEKSILAFLGGSSDAFFMKLSDYFYIENISQSSVACDLNNMSINLTVSGGNSPLSFLWSNGNTSQNLSGISIGTYSVTITDNSTCSISETIELSPPTGEPINLPATITMCFYDTITIDAGNNFSNYLWSTGANTQSISVSNIGNYSVTATDYSGCQSFTTVQVNRLPNKDIFTNSEYYYCRGSFVEIFAGAYQEYLWSNSSTAQYIQVSSPSQINIRVFDGSCYYLDTIQVSQFPDPVVDLGPNKVICKGDSILLTTTTPFVTYFWTNGSNEESCYVSQQGYYFVQVSDENSCYGIDSIYISTTEKPVANLGNDTLLCVSSYTLNPQSTSGFNTYLWSTGETTNTINISNTGSYWVEITATNNACVVRDTINVQIFPSFSVNIGDDQNICPGELANFTIDTTAMSILWMNGSSDTSINVSTEGIVAVVITNEIGCIATDSAEVFLRFVESPNLGADTVLCNGASMVLDCEIEAESYLWNTGATTSSIIINQAGIYSVTISNEYACTVSDQILVSYENPPQFSSINTNYGRIEIFIEGGQAPYYYFLDNTSNSQTSNLFVNCNEGFHNVYVMDAYSCMTDTTVEVKPVYKVPSFFTPNEDGFNDVWEIYGFHLFPNGVASVYDRYGKLLYSFKGGEEGWRGDYAGEAVPADTYWYVIDFKDGNVAKGSVTVIR